MDGFAYNQSVELSATDQAIYQQDVVIHRTAGIPYEELVGGLYVLHFYVGDKCEADYRDVRFTDAIGNALAYYLWPDYDSSSARFTVRLEGATSAGQMQIWYGNPSAASESAGGAVFLVFDEFSGASLDTDIWSEIGGATTTLSAGIAQIVTPSGAEFKAGIQSKATSLTDIVIETRMKGSSRSNAAIMFRTTGSNHYPAEGVFLKDEGGMYLFRKTSGTAKTILTSGGTVGKDTFYEFKVIVSGSTCKVLADGGVQIDTTTDSSMPASGGVGFSDYALQGYPSVDWIRVRAYSATPPAATAFGPEQRLRRSSGIALGSANMMVI